jgi:hypothetical protein
VSRQLYSAAPIRNYIKVTSEALFMRRRLPCPLVDDAHSSGCFSRRCARKRCPSPLILTITPRSPNNQTTSSFRSYKDWTGNGIKSITVLKESEGSSVVRYQAGALGLNFDFTLKWTRQTSPNHVPYVITFENVRKEGLVGSLSGAYMIDQVQGVSVINFDFSSSLRYRILEISRLSILSRKTHWPLLRSSQSPINSNPKP